MGRTQLGMMIRDARHEAGLKLEQVAEKVGVTPGALSHIESGRRLPSPSSAMAIADVLHIDPRELLTALDVEHSMRRERTAYESRGSAESPQSAKPRPAAYSPRPIEDLFAFRSDATLRQMPPDEPGSAGIGPEMPAGYPEFAPSVRNTARWSDDTPQRLQALEQLADTASDAIRTLRGLLEDEDPMVRREARRLLRELDVRLPEE